MSTSKTQKSKKPLIILLDMHAILHRGYHAMEGFTSIQGEPSGALYSLMLMVTNLYEEFDPHRIIACYDMPEKTFRHIAYTDYKAGRKQTDDSLIFQINESRNMVDLCGIKSYGVPGFEADDLLGTFAQIIPEDYDILIASGDMDTLQLVRKNRIRVYTLKKTLKETIIYNEEKVFERFGFGPTLIPDYKALYGDPGDNIKGIKGIGDKTASILIQNFGSIEQIYKKLKKNKDELLVVITKRMVGLLEEGEEDAEFSKILATIRIDAPIEFDITKDEFFKRSDELREYLTRFSMKTLVTRLLKITETRDREKSQDGLFRDAIDIKEVEAREKEERKEAVDNLSYQKQEEIKIMYWMLHSEKTNPDLKEIKMEYGDESFESIEKKLYEKIEKEGLVPVYENIEKPLIPLLVKIKEKGLLFNREQNDIVSKKIHKDLAILEKEIHELAGVEFNIRSPKQLGEVLYETLGASKGLKIKKNASGGFSTKESELEKMIDVHPVIAKILNYRELHKMQSTYVDLLPTFIESDGAIHSDLLQYGASTGRFSSQNPNMQNIPNKGEYANPLRSCFYSREGFSFLSFDYSQIELRIAAILSNDASFIEIFKNGRDIHSEVAMRVWNLKEEEVTKENRRKAKAINFGILYGAGATTLSKNLSVSRKDAEQFIEDYFKTFPTLKSYLDSVAKKH